MESERSVDEYSIVGEHKNPEELVARHHDAGNQGSPPVRFRPEYFKWTHHELSIELVLLLHQVEFLASGDVIFVVRRAMETFHYVKGLFSSAFGQ